MYWDIGGLILARKALAGHGQAVVQRLAADLQAAHPGASGLSASNLWRCKVFRETYEASPKLAPLVREIGWSHNLIILERCKNDQQREFYLRMTKRMGWTKTVLVHQIETRVFEKTLTAQTSFEHTLPAPRAEQAILALKDSYTFDFLDLQLEHSERELERAILGRIERFLREMGGMFAFLGSQYRIEIGDREYFIDLLLYHRRLRCLVAIDLKVVEFQPEFVGKMQFYLAALDDVVRVEGENPSIGMILCKDKHRVTVEYALRESNKPIGVATYTVTNHLPVDLAGMLPAPEDIDRLLRSLDTAGSEGAEVIQ
jgi:predicted nuclease of restriction endonuclease-like (RecB) superfamily